MLFHSKEFILFKKVYNKVDVANTSSTGVYTLSSTEQALLHKQAE